MSKMKLSLIDMASENKTITTELYYRRELSAIGSIQLFFFSKNCGTIMGIAYSAHTAKLSSPE